MTDMEIIEQLIRGDERVCRQFFFENCRPLFSSVISKTFSYHVEYDEFVNELYIYLMGNDAARKRKGIRPQMAFNTIRLVKKLGWDLVKI